MVAFGFLNATRLRCALALCALVGAGSAFAVDLVDPMQPPELPAPGTPIGMPVLPPLPGDSARAVAPASAAMQPKLQGIFRTNGKGSAASMHVLVDGQLLQPGVAQGAYKVTAVYDSEVDLEIGGQTMRLSLYPQVPVSKIVLTQNRPITTALLLTKTPSLTKASSTSKTLISTKSSVPTKASRVTQTMPTSIALRTTPGPVLQFGATGSFSKTQTVMAKASSEATARTETSAPVLVGSAAKDTSPLKAAPAPGKARPVAAAASDGSLPESFFEVRKLATPAISSFPWASSSARP